jgi:16S rRNA (cytidine1402-2'-O)-methyltransferase
VPLVLIGTPIGNLADLSPRAADVLRAADVIACEDTRRTRGLLSHVGIAAGRRLRAVHEHNEATESARIVQEVAGGATVAYVTDAGMPTVSDPGALLVRACRAAGVPVEVVPGPSAVMAALALSGFPADRFVFEGFLARKGRSRAEQLGAIAAEPRTVVLFEAPGRVAGTLADLARACGGDRSVWVGRELTKRFEASFVDDLAGAVSALGEVEPRGEHVIVLAGAAGARAVPSPGALEAAVAEALGRGLSARDAAAEVAAVHGGSKRAAYEVAVRLREGSRVRRR